jgi:general L-amino acid transport system permease protein
MSGSFVDPRYAANRAAPTSRVAFRWSDPVFRSFVFQLAVLVALGLVVWFLATNTGANLAAQGRSAGFDYLKDAAAISPGEAMLPWTPNVSTYAWLFVEGIINTIRVAIPGVILSTILGTLIGIGRLSKNWLLAKTTQAYVDGLRNIPVLLQLVTWHILFQYLPPPRAAINLVNVLLFSGRGIYFAELEWSGAFTGALIGFIAGLIGLRFWLRAARVKQDQTGVRPRSWPVALALLIGLPLVIWVIMGAPFHPELPALKGFNIRGGGTVTTEYITILTGLVIYTSSYVAEIVRSGIQAVPQGQWEAANALGLKPGAVLRQVVLPQAMRVIIPPMTSQFLNLTKNSSLGVAVGYPELVEVFSATLEPTGKALEGMAIVMIVYLSFSLSISLFMNWYNKHIALVER